MNSEDGQLGSAPRTTAVPSQKEVAKWSHPIQAVAFDMDGLLVNTEELYTEVGTTVLLRRGKSFTPELKRSMMGLPGQQAFELMISHEQLTDSVEDLARESELIFNEILPTRLKLLTGVTELLDELENRGLPRCVATSSSKAFADKVLSIVALSDRIDFVITPVDVLAGKPQPDIYLAAAERMGVQVRNMLVLEDSHHGSRAGVASGACTVAVPGPHSEEHDFSGVHYRAQSLVDPGLWQILHG